MLRANRLTSKNQATRPPLGRSDCHAQDPDRPACYDRPMPSTESSYFLVINIVVGTMAGVFLAKLVTTNLRGWSYLVFIFATLGALSLCRDAWNAFNQMRFRRRSQEAYEKVARIFKPEIINPERPGNLHFMREQAQRAVDDATVLIDRMGKPRPTNIDINDDASVREWYEYLRPLRRNQY